MLELITAEALAVLAVSFGVGIVVGLTGMGGGALMTPGLILLGIHPAAAVANDLVAASINKTVGAAVHWREGSPNLRLAGILIMSSVPFAFAGGFIVHAIGDSEARSEFLLTAIGWALLLAAASYAARLYVLLRHVTKGEVVQTGENPKIRLIPTVTIGAFGGLLVGITSVGSGSIIMVTLLLIYPTMSAVKLVGTDLVQAVPLVLAAAIGHIITEGVLWSVLIPLVIGGMPGTFLGARLAGWVPQSVVRRGIVIVLTLTGFKLLGMPAEWVGLSGAVMLIIGPLFWGLVRQSRGLPAFEHRSDLKRYRLHKKKTQLPAEKRADKSSAGE